MKYAILCILVLGALGCQKIPPLKADLLIGDSQSQSLIGAVPEEDVACSEPAFDDQICMSREEFVEEFMLRFECKQWKAGTKLIDPRSIDIPDFLQEAVDEATK